MKFKSYELKEFGPEEPYDTWVHTTLEDMLPEEVEDLVERKVLCEPAHEVHDENKSSLLQRALEKNSGTGTESGKQSRGHQNYKRTKVRSTWTDQEGDWPTQWNCETSWSTWQTT